MVFFFALATKEIVEAVVAELGDALVNDLLVDFVVEVHGRPLWLL